MKLRILMDGDHDTGSIQWNVSKSDVSLLSYLGRMPGMPSPYSLPRAANRLMPGQFEESQNRSLCL